MFMALVLLLANNNSPTGSNSYRCPVKWIGFSLVISNLLRIPEERNKLGGDISEMFLFNDAISALGVMELPLLGRK